VSGEAQHQQQVEELCAATIRALSGEPDLHFRGRRLHRGGQALPLFGPHLQPSLEHDDFASFRGAADGLGLRLLHSDQTLHRRLCPAHPVQRLLFEALEQFRVEALVQDTMPGAKHNLRHRHEAWSLAFHHSGLTETQRGMLIYTALQMCRSRVTAEPVVEATEDPIETTRARLAPLLGHALAALRRARADQAAYAEHALSIARTVAAMIGTLDGGEGTAGGEAVDDEPQRGGFTLLMDFDAETAEGFSAPASGRSAVFEAAQGSYRTFTTAYDREVAAATLVRPALLKELRERLDRRIAEQGVNVHRLARQLKALLALPMQDGWDGAQEEGRIDGSRLAQLISSPTERRLFRTDRIEPIADCVMTVLIDCSGSMKQHSEAVAAWADVLARALELAGVTSEVLGFTTGAWTGGRARRDWQRAGRPTHPGRLNERCHLVFKSADTPWRRARPAIAALLKADLFREGLDGEAVQWACGRLQQRSEARRLLVVISDGCPMDSATQLANDAFYLDNHLKQVLQQVQERGNVEVFGIGVGLDLSPYYGRCVAVDPDEASGNALFRELLELLAGRHRR
jgi:cobaltochelatase CobT